MFMDMNDYDYNLPEALIAQTPLQNRASSNLLVLEPNSTHIQHDVFYNIINYLKKGDCLVLNDSRVIPVRLLGHKKDTFGKIEVLLLHKTEEDTWEALVKPAKKVKTGTEIIFGDGQLIATCTAEKDDGARLLKLSYEGIFLEVLDQLGHMPLPPYIKEKLEDKERYQTVYAKEEGSAAAPTAGLHFTEELLERIQEMGVNIAYITLHVGLGTFRPVTVEHMEDHHMHSEYYSMTAETAKILNDTKLNQGKIIAVGTTTTRVLETIARDFANTFQECSGWTDIYIYPPFTFKAIDGLLTNFHLPKSSLLLLISAFAGRENMLAAYEEAIKHKYRFFSFGDAMFILPKRNERS